VGLQPRLGDHAGAGTGWAIEGGDESECLKDEGQRGGEEAKEGKAVCSADDEVEEDHGPAQEDQDLEEVGQGAGVECMAADDEEASLEGEAGSH